MSASGAISKIRKNINTDDISDPILLFIDKIRTEYCNYKKEKDDIITALKKTNSHLTETINDLNDKLNSTFESINNGDKKRRKTNSSDESDLDSKKLFGQVNILDSSSDKSSNSPTYKILNDKSIRVILNTQTKTNLSDDSDLENSKLINKLKIYDSSSDKSIDSALNEAITDENILLNDSEIFPPTQKTPTKRSITPPIRNILSPSNKNNVINKIHISPPITPSLTKKLSIPRRMASRTSTINSENQNPIKRNDFWISKNEIKQKTKTNLNMSFIQPVKLNYDNLNSSGEVIACSQNVSPSITNKSERHLRRPNKLQQSRLEFDVFLKSDLNAIKKEDANETFCEEIVGASPTCTDSSANSKLIRTLRKKPIKKTDDDLFVFPMKKSLSNEFVATSNRKEITAMTSRSPTLTPNKNQIKEEPKTVEKDVLLKSRFFEHMLTDDTIDGLETIIDNDVSNKEDTVKKMLNDNSSLFILPSQPDDVIFVDDSDKYDYNLSSMDLLAEIMRDEKETQPLLKKFENEQIKSLQSSDSHNKKSQPSTSTSRLQLSRIKNKVKSENDEILLSQATKLSEIFDDKNDFTASFKVPEKKEFHHDCDECQKFKKYLISQNVPPDEIEKRLRTCKMPQKLHHTPEGFWDPVFREFPPNDPRNEVLNDYRFVNKKNNEK